MDSQDFIEDYPEITIKFAQRLVRAHGLAISELDDAVDVGDVRLTASKMVKTADFILWLGY